MHFPRCLDFWFALKHRIQFASSHGIVSVNTTDFRSIENDYFFPSTFALHFAVSICRFRFALCRVLLMDKSKLSKYVNYVLLTRIHMHSLHGQYNMYENPTWIWQWPLLPIFIYFLLLVWRTVFRINTHIRIEFYRFDNCHLVCRDDVRSHWFYHTLSITENCKFIANFRTTWCTTKK